MTELKEFKIVFDNEYYLNVDKYNKEGTKGYFSIVYSTPLPPKTKFKIKQIDNYHDKAIITLTNCGNTKIIATLKVDEIAFDEMLSLVEPEEKKNPWTEWRRNECTSYCLDCSCRECPFMYICDIDDDDIEYKTNGKKIMVRYTMLNGKVIKSHSTCNKVDTFNLNTGLKVALARLNIKIAEENFKSLIETV